MLEDSQSTYSGLNVGMFCVVTRNCLRCSYLTVCAIRPAGIMTGASSTSYLSTVCVTAFLLAVTSYGLFLELSVSVSVAAFRCEELDVRRDSVCKNVL